MTIFETFGSALGVAIARCGWAGRGKREVAIGTFAAAGHTRQGRLAG